VCRSQIQNVLVCRNIKKFEKRWFKLSHCSCTEGDNTIRLTLHHTVENASASKTSYFNTLETAEADISSCSQQVKRCKKSFREIFQMRPTETYVCILNFWENRRFLVFCLFWATFWSLKIFRAYSLAFSKRF